MIKPLFLSIPPGTTYMQLQHPITFIEDYAGVANWAMRFPRLLYSHDLRQKHVFNQGKVEIIKCSNPNLQQKWKYFVITKADGKRFHCTAQTYYEKAPIKCLEGGFFQGERQVYRQFFVPKCLVLLSELPYYKMHVNLLKIYKQLKKPEPIISYCISEQLLKTYIYLLENKREGEWNGIVIKPNCLSSNQLLQRGSHNGWKKISCSTQTVFNYYLHCCNEHYKGQTIYMEKANNREVLHCYKLYNNTLYQICYIFHLPFSPRTLRLIFSAILQEKQIIFSCANQNLNTLIVETVMEMLLPFKWTHMFVPNMPLHLLEAAQEAFMPMIVGISKKHLQYLQTDHMVVVHVQQNTVEYDPDNLIQLHPCFQQYFTYQGNDTKNYLEWEKEIRIKAILFMSHVLGKCSKEEHAMMLTERSITSLHSISTSSVNQSFIGNSKYNLTQNNQDGEFFSQMVANSMLYRQYRHEIKDQTSKQMGRLMEMSNNQEKKAFLTNRFGLICSQTQYPIKIDNQKQWIRYYEQSSRLRKKFRLNRYSLNVSHSNSSMIEESLTSNNSVNTIEGLGTVGSQYSIQNYNNSGRSSVSSSMIEGINPLLNQSMMSFSHPQQNIPIGLYATQSIHIIPSHQYIQNNPLKISSVKVSDGNFLMNGSMNMSQSVMAQQREPGFQFQQQQQFGQTTYVQPPPIMMMMRKNSVTQSTIVL